VPAPGLSLYLIAFALGCAVGSFLNVCIYRMPRERSVVFPPSHCPQCGARLRAAELIPLLSFLALGRKCRHCGGPISWRYFAVELLTGLLFVAALYACGLHAQLLACLIFTGVVIAVIFTDLDHMIIPDKLVVAALLAAVLSEALAVISGRAPLLSVAIPGTSLALPRVVAGGAVGLAAFIFIRGFSQLLFRREGMGLGDVKLAGAMGALLGPGLALLSFGLAVVSGAVVGVLLMLLRLRRRMEYLPFGPFLAASGLLVLLAPAGLTHAAGAIYARWLEVLGL
jgi:leader peptidase (prepilin peptidase)/N-methyltransferase